MRARVCTRVHESTKKLLKTLPYTEAEVIKIGAEYLADESNLLEWQIGELKVEINNVKSNLHEMEALLQAKKNRLRMIAPKKLDEETLYNMLIESAKEVAESIFEGRGLDSLSKIENSVAKASIMKEGKDLGYDPHDFLVEVKNQLEIKCQTQLSDISECSFIEMSDD